MIFCFTIYLIINKDNNQGEENSLLGNIIFIGVGVLFAVVSIIVIIKTVKKIKNNKPLTEEEVKANEEKESEESKSIENVTDTKLYFHFGGKLNQSFFVEDRNGITRYECRLKKFNLVGANTFEFVDINHNYSKEFKMGKAVTSSADGGIPIMGDELSSSFKINGVNCWEYLRNKGYKLTIVS